MRLTVILAALCAVLFASNAEARPKHHLVGVNKVIGRHHIPEIGKMVGCSDPVMRPCGGTASTVRKFRTVQHIDQTRKFAKRWENPTSMSFGLARVMAEGAGRVIGRRPRAWCGWWMRKHLGVANPAGNLARWWAGFGRPAHGPHVGAIVVWRHHVGKITGRTADGRWVVKSGNDGHRVRERPRSVAGAIAFRWPA